MLTWAHERRVALRPIEPGKPTPNACIESFNRRFRDECLYEHCFTSLAHAEVVIGASWREYNEERPKKGLGGLTPTASAQQPQSRAGTVSSTVPMAPNLSTRGVFAGTDAPSNDPSFARAVSASR